MLLSDQERWQAVVERDARADGKFYYAVKTTGVFCRPSCAARLARRENVSFHATSAAASAAGFRPCKRCQPERERHAEAVERACQLIAEAETAPDLEALAAAAGLSPSHFHRVFKSLTGLTPKAYTTAHRSQRLRHELDDATRVTDAIYAAGFNSAGRFYSNSAERLGMKPREFKAGGPGVLVRFGLGECWLGSILVAGSEVGICAIMLGDDPEALLRALQDRFPRAELVGGDAQFERWMGEVIAFVERPSAGLQLPLDVQGTAFQERVWRLLRQIPYGETRSYSQLARELGQPRASRAVAGACGANPLAVAIPCHRVVRHDGALSGYRWGVERKARLLESEGNPFR